MKKHGTTILLIVIFTLGLCLLLYPTVSDWWNSSRQSKAITSYSETVENMQQSEYSAIIAKAHEFNEIIKKKGVFQYLSDEEMKKYTETLDITGTGIMGYIEIPSINVSLPIYHTVEEDVLQVAVGHIEWTSLPVGGESTHCVLSGHRGLPSAKLFTNLDKLVEGDIFTITVLNETLTYQVDQVLIVEPEDTDDLYVIEGEDLCTLITCTPYGINSHRLLVRGHRIENIEEESPLHVTSEAFRIDPLLVAPVVAAPILLALLVYVLIKYKRKKK
ncbi:MAG: class C sortase [Clostridia bacterium]|nr:class C sortase [Clostridia bacterium]